MWIAAIKLSAAPASMLARRRASLPGLERRIPVPAIGDAESRHGVDRPGLIAYRGRTQHNTTMSDGSGLYEANQGTGPGVITPDGCAVEFYALLRPRQEPEIVAGAAPSTHASVLELGAGTGRIADALAELGHPVVAVDESPEMLARIRRADPVCAQIQGLALGRRFDVVLLASFLINAPDKSVRRAFLETCARHVSDDGYVIIQQHPPGWFTSVAEAEYVWGEMTFRLRNLSHPAPGLVSARAEYQAGDRIWTHSFTAARLDEPALHATLAEAGLAFDRYLTGDHEWLRAVPVTPSSPPRGCARR
jgi:2-polyprenyl-3-methyl-5-hydroxy-6-metoxy-1,4-benzoquinol methylase